MAGVRQQLGDGLGGTGGVVVWVTGALADGWADGATLAVEVVLVSVGDADGSGDVDVSAGVGLGFALWAGGGAADVVPGLSEVGLQDGGAAGWDPVPAGP